MMSLMNIEILTFLKCIYLLICNPKKLNTRLVMSQGATKIMLMKSLRELLVMSYSPLTECQQICYHAIYKFLREKIGNLAMWFPKF